MKTFLTSLLVLFSVFSFGTTYKVNSISGMNVGIVGDSVLLQRGATYIGTSFTARAGVIYSYWGEGSQPNLIVRFLIPGNNTVVDGLSFIDTRLDSTNHSIQALIGTAIDISGNNNTVKNCIISRVGCGVLVSGTGNLITRNKVFNMRMIVTDNAPDNDYGAIPFLMSGPSNTFTYNTVDQAWGNSVDYTYDGGCFEIYGTNTSNNIIMYNKTSNSDGFIEFGSNAAGTASNIVIAYNISINCGGAVYVNSSGQYAITAKNLQFYNNIFVETKYNFLRYTNMVGYGGGSTLVFKNNIFYLATGINFTNNSTNMIHQDNVYRITNGGGVGMILDASEFNTTMALFTNTISADPSQWNFRPLSTSPAVGNGQSLGYVKDIDGEDVYIPVTIGAKQFPGTLSLPPTGPGILIPTNKSFVYYNGIIYLNQRRSGQLVIYTIDGKLLDVRYYKVNRSTIDVSSFPKGVYVIRLEFETHQFVR